MLSSQRLYCRLKTSDSEYRYKLQIHNVRQCRISGRFRTVHHPNNKIRINILLVMAMAMAMAMITMVVTKDQHLIIS